MVNNNQVTKTISLEEYGIKNAKVNYQLSPDQLHAITVEKGQGVEASSGALAVNTGEFTGRSPKDRFIVKDDITKDRVWWGDINIPFDADKFDKLYDKRLLVRLIGVRCSDLAGGNYQISLFEDAKKTVNLYQAMDKIRSQYGGRSIFRASTLGVKSIGDNSNPFDGKPPIVLAHRTQ